MKSYVARRSALGLLTIFGVVVAVFFLTHVLPGNSAFARAGQFASPAIVAAIKKQMGLDLPLGEQFLHYVAGLAHLNLGVSANTGQSVVHDLGSRFPATAELGLSSVFIALVLGLPTGLLAGLRPNSVWDRIARFGAVVATSLPIFWFGLVLSFVFYFRLGIAPAPSGRLSAFATAPPTITGSYVIDSVLHGDILTCIDALQHLALPAMTLGLVVTAPILKIVRSATIDVMGQDYIRTAQALGLSQWRIVREDVIRNVGVQFLTSIAIVLGFVLSGSVLVEQVFSWPGIGRYALGAMQASDDPAIQGFILLVAVIYVGINLATDLLYAFIDPRISLD